MASAAASAGRVAVSSITSAVAKGIQFLASTAAQSGKLWPGRSEARVSTRALRALPFSVVDQRALLFSVVE